MNVICFHNPDEENGYTTVFPIPEKIRQMNPGWKQHPGY